MRQLTNLEVKHINGAATGFILPAVGVVIAATIAGTVLGAGKGLFDADYVSVRDSGLKGIPYNMVIGSFNSLLGGAIGFIAGGVCGVGLGAMVAGVIILS